MHEIRATLPPEQVERSDPAGPRRRHRSHQRLGCLMFMAPTQRRQVISVETSTPKARAFVEALLGSAEIRGADYSMTSRELRAIVNGEDVMTSPSP